MMTPEIQRPRITEINVRIDCNGCVQKIKKALYGINGIYDFYIDGSQQKLTIIGWADPERIIKAIKKVRKVATICSHTEAPDTNFQPTETPPPDGGEHGGAPPTEGAPPQDEGNPQPEEHPQSQEAIPPPQEPSTDQPPPPEPPENISADTPQPESNPNPPAEPQQNHPENYYKPRDVEEAHVLHHPPDYRPRSGYTNGYAPDYRHEQPPQPVYHEPPSHHIYHERPRPIYHDSQPHYVYHETSSHPIYHEPPSQSYHESPSRPVYHEPSRSVYHEPPSRSVYHEPQSQPIYTTCSYNMYSPSPSITEYQYARSPPEYTNYGMMDQYHIDSYRNGGANNGNVTSIFSDENPNACTIM